MTRKVGTRVEFISESNYSDTNTMVQFYEKGRI